VPCVKLGFNMYQALYLIRGVSGAGKTSFAERIFEHVISADHFFEKDGKYYFDPKKLRIAHEWCLKSVEGWLIEGKTVAVANTFTQDWEMEPYFKLAKEFKIPIYSIIVENRHGGTNVHGVPADVIEKQTKRFEVKLV
jgi:predicted kinase